MSSTFVLIHGAWHGAWCWRHVVPLLQSAGHTVLAPDLPSHGQDPTPPSTVTLNTYTERVCEVLAAQTGPVILVGHSMGGIVLTQTAELVPERIAALVYVCAFLPGSGESLMTWATQDQTSLVNPSTTEPLPDGSIRFKPEHARAAFYGNCTEEDTAFAQSRLVPQPAAPFGTPVQTTAERWGKTPRFYIECARDRAITLPLQRAMQNQSPCREVFTLDTDHSPFFSAPDALASIFGRIATA